LDPFENEGPEYERYNEIPMFRYNTYFGINTVHYLDLVETSAAKGSSHAENYSFRTADPDGKGDGQVQNKERILKPFAEDLFNQLGSLKFISYVKPDGFPVIVPVIQCQAADSRRLAFCPMAFRDELLKIPKDTTVALFGLTMKMEDVLVRGVFRELSPSHGVNLGNRRYQMGVQLHATGPWTDLSGGARPDPR
jgi:hypothetical protein